MAPELIGENAAGNDGQEHSIARICPSCGCSAPRSMGKIPASDVFAGRRLDKPLDGGGLYRCRRCRLAFRFPLRSEQELDELYQSGIEDAWSANPAARNDWQIAGRWLSDSLVAGSSVLDVGCFDGRFLETVGNGYRRCGIEIHSAAASRASSKGIEIVGQHYRQLATMNRKFDAIVSFDLIEHVPDPVSFLALLSGALATAGLAIVSSGNVDAWSWRIMGSRYWYCTISEHISFISPRWCRLALPAAALDLQRQARFSHGGDGPLRSANEAAANLAYRLFPGGIAWMRRHGVGGKDVSRHPALAEHPPSWMMARDHFIFMARRYA